MKLPKGDEPKCFTKSMTSDEDPLLLSNERAEITHYLDKSQLQPTKPINIGLNLNGFLKLFNIKILPLPKSQVNPPDKLSITNDLVIELDPFEYYPNEPYTVQHFRRKYRKQALWDQMPYKCNICNKGFKILKGLLSHKRLKHDIEDLSGCYPCECCIQVFWMKRDLMLHVVEHQDINGRYPCPEDCGVAELDIPRLARHKSLHHPYLGTLGRSWFHTWCDR